MPTERKSDRVVWPLLTLLLVTLVAGALLYTVNRRMSDSLNSQTQSVSSAPDPAEVEYLLDDAYWYLSQGETETALELLEEFQAYCEMTGEEVPAEAEELYDEALEEWLLYSVDTL